MRTKFWWQFRNGTLVRVSLPKVAWLRQFSMVYVSWDRGLGGYVYYDDGRVRK